MLYYSLLHFSLCLWTCNAEHALIDNYDASAWHDCYDTVTLLAHKYYSIKIFGSYSILKQLKWLQRDKIESGVMSVKNWEKTLKMGCFLVLKSIYLQNVTWM